MGIKYRRPSYGPHTMGAVYHIYCSNFLVLFLVSKDRLALVQSRIFRYLCSDKPCKSIKLDYEPID